jgi:KDO2-lipid IV(A) lauroyltransferase
LKDPYFNAKLSLTREKYGMVLCLKNQTRSYFERSYPKPSGVIFAIDQSPSNPSKCHWMTFLHQDTPVLFGAERYAVEFDRPVLFCTIHKTKRGHYEGELQVITEHPKTLAQGKITELNTEALERDIRAKPEYWLWTHRRWKHKRPVEHSAREKSSSTKG